MAQSVELAQGMGVETILRAPRLAATPAMTDDNQLSFKLPSVSRKKVTAAFDGGRLSSDSGVMLLVSGALSPSCSVRSDPEDVARLDWIGSHIWLTI